MQEARQALADLARAHGVDLGDLAPIPELTTPVTATTEATSAPVTPAPTESTPARHRPAAHARRR
jgi:hypothetical protein